MQYVTIIVLNAKQVVIIVQCAVILVELLHQVVNVKMDFTGFKQQEDVRKQIIIFTK